MTEQGSRPGPERPRYRRRRLVLVAAALPGYAAGWLYATFIGCHGT